MKYIIYLRVSTDRQDVDSQRSACLNYIQKHGGGEWLEFTDIAVSGSSDMEERDEMLNAIDALQPGDVFLIDTRDRLGRVVYSNIVVARKIAERGAKLECASQDMSYMDPGTMQLMQTILDAFAQFELYQIGRRTRNKLKEMKKNGFRTGRIPYGYQLGQAVEQTVMTNKGPQKKISYKLTRNVTEQEILEKMQNWAKSGISQREIAKRLNESGILNRENHTWSHVSIHKILNNAPRHRDVYSEIPA